MQGRIDMDYFVSLRPDQAVLSALRWHPEHAVCLFGELNEGLTSKRYALNRYRLAGRIGFHRDKARVEEEIANSEG